MHRLAPIAALAGVLFAGRALAVAPPTGSAAGPPAAAESTAGPKLAPADQERVTAIQQYQHDLVTVVALRAEPDYLLGAAILAKPFNDQTPGLNFDALSARAETAPGAGPAIHWQRLVACKKSKADCPDPEALAWLEQHAAGNAAVWIVAMDVAAGNKDAGAERAALGKAAAAQAYDDYYGQTLAGIAKAVAVLPPLPATTQGAHDGQPDNPEGVRVLVSVNAAQALPRPDLDPVVAWCDKDAVAGHRDRRGACLKLAHTLQWGSSPIARAAGLHIEGALESADEAQADQASRNLQWQVQQYSHLLQRSLTDATLASGWLTTARNGGTELSLILATLRANGVPIEAPSGGSAAPASAGSTPR